MAAVMGDDARITGLLDRMFMGNRGPSPDFPSEPGDTEELLGRVIRREMKRATVEIKGDYHEGGGGEGQWSKWIATGVVALIVAGVGGGIAMFGKLSSLEAKVESVQNQVNDVKRIVEPRYRGEPAS